MHWIILLAVVVIVLLGILFYFWTLARRLDLLHRRVMATRLAIGRTLVKRAAEALQLADTGVLDPEACEQLISAARSCLQSAEDPLTDDELGLVLPAGARESKDANRLNDTSKDDRYLVESHLSQTLRALLQQPQRQALEADPLGKVLLADIDETAYRLKILRTMHNQDVAQVQSLRRKKVVRLFHLAGRATIPQYIDYDDLT